MKRNATGSVMNSKLKPTGNILTKPAIILALACAALTATAETRLTNEFWVCTNATGKFPWNGQGGTLDNPYDGSTRANFDGVLSNLPPYSTLHILAGTYETAGNLAVP